MAEISKWYVVHTYSGYENKVATNIEKIVENRKMHDLILEVKVPTEIVVENKEAKDKETGERIIVKKEVERKIFPGYVMVKVAVFEDEETGDLEMTDDTWYVIRNTRGVTGFVGPESKPIPLTEAEVYAMGVEKKVIKIDYEVGDMVTIIDGAFEGIIGSVRELDVDNNVVCVVISMLGRETPVDLELDQVEKVEE
ncbi:MAG: transcription termination/antitermination factor NusG [Clostridia bacterium]|nr:transcription termination/antitermination factor NusG [Clostridia bacterium]